MWLLQVINRPFNYAIVDEVDSILIDDCRNPMLISGMSYESADRFQVAREVNTPWRATCTAVMVPV